MYCMLLHVYFCFFKQKTAYEMRISYWSSDVCSSDLKRQLYADMAGCLAPGGALVVCDLVETLTAEGRRLYAEAWDDGVRRIAVELDGDLAAFDRFRADDWNFYAMREPDPVDKPDPLFDQLKGLDRKSTRLNSSH